MTAPDQHLKKPPPPAIAPPGRLRTTLWLATTLAAGAILMGLEMVAFRLYAPQFGNTIYVWGNLIAIVMVAMAIGYAFGGRLADRSTTDRPLYVMILISAAYQLVIVQLVRILLPWLAQTTGEIAGTTLATLIVFAPPMILLAAVGPFVVRLLARMGHVGSTAGYVSALSTFGSVVGTLLTAFVLVQALGTMATMKLACAATTILGVAGLVGQRRAVAIAVAPLILLPVIPDIGEPKGTVWSAESAYNHVRVVRKGGRLALVLNEEGTVQTVRNERSGWTDRYWDLFALGPLLVPTDRLLILGMGAGAGITATHAVDPDVDIHAVEIDPKVAEAAVEYFDIEPGDKVHIHIADARPWLARHDEVYDLIHVDIYQGGPYVPFYLVTEEFFRLVRDRLTDDGMMIMNVLDVGSDRPLLNAIGATLARVFDFLAVVDTHDGNSMVFAFPTDRDLDQLRQKLRDVDMEEPVQTIAQRSAERFERLVPPPDATVFTDDHAPVEGITRRMLAGYRPSPG